jgi:hypothetical protein
LSKNALVAAASLVELKKKSSVFPCASTARYSYTHCFLTLMEVSSTRQESVVGFKWGDNGVQAQGHSTAPTERWCYDPHASHAPASSLRDPDS